MKKSLFAAFSAIVLGLIVAAAPANASVAGVTPAPGVSSAPSAPSGNVSAKSIRPSIYGCPNDTTDKGAICLYNWITYNSSGGVWKRAIGDLGASSDGGESGCTNLNDWYWDGLSGSANLVYDHASSIIINASIPNANGYYAYFYEWVNCNQNGRYFTCYMPSSVSTPFVYGIQNLTNVPTASGPDCNSYGSSSSGNFYDTIGSIKVVTAPGGP